MIRQAINCDMCGAERLEGTSRWFVADEIKGEIRLRGWESPQKSRRNARHLCGQKCVQRIMDNFTATILAGQQAGKAAAKEAAELAPVAVVTAAAPVALPPSPAATAKAPVLVESALDRDELPILERMGYDRETIAQVEADSWAGPVREIPAKPKEVPAKEQQAKDTWGAENRGEKGFIHAARLKPQPLRTTFQRMA